MVSFDSQASWIFPTFSYILVGCLAYGSQILFRYLEPHSLTASQAIHFNLIVACVFIGYTRSWLVDPGRVPPDWQPSRKANRGRWCRKCLAMKPQRAHHCKVCKRCIPKMDHHCPWTVNCVSYKTLPHFIRFLFYGIWSLILLNSYLYKRVTVLWSSRHLPSYLGPSTGLMTWLFVLTLVSGITTLCIGILFIRCLWSLFNNVTSIESWEIERHATLLRRAKAFGGYLDGPEGQRIPIKRQEFPYDIGIWNNLVQVFGSNPLFWLWPLAKTPDIANGIEFEVNGFEDSNLTWPPPDPDRMPRTRMNLVGTSTMHDKDIPNIETEEFLARLVERSNASGVQRRKPFHERYASSDSQLDIRATASLNEDGEESWKSSEGERLADFGLDEEIEFYDENPSIRTPFYTSVRTQ